VLAGRPPPVRWTTHERVSTNERTSSISIRVSGSAIVEWGGEPAVGVQPLGQRGRVTADGVIGGAGLQRLSGVPVDAEAGPARPQ
jgi:hypothetical protein